MIASNYTLVAANAGNTSIQSGQTINVHCISAANESGSAETVTILESDGTTEIVTLQVPANSTVETTCEFYARSGLSVTPGANTSVTVFHSQGGA